MHARSSSGEMKSLRVVIQATDIGGPEQYLRRAVRRCRRASTERQFDLAYESLVAAISKAPLCA